MTPDLAEKIERAGQLDLGHEVVLIPGEEILVSALRKAVERARASLEDASEDEQPPG